MILENYYRSLGTYFKNENNVKNNVNIKLYNTSEIKIVLVGLNEPREELKPVYKILRVDYNGEDPKQKKIVEQLNRYLKENGLRDGYKDEKNFWGIFYLLKEIITSFQELDFNYFRGQSQQWEAIPRIFRRMENNNGELFYEKFEGLYKTISQEFPDDLTYHCLNQENIEKRCDQLSILQHYGFPTSLLDITENPYIAMLFMVSSDEMVIPKFEMYQIDRELHTEKSIVSFVHKVDKNKRIRAQRGAFLNYDKLSKYTRFEKENIVLSSDYVAINKVVISLEFSKEETVKELENLLEEVPSSTEDPGSKELTNKNLENLIELIKNKEKEMVGSYYRYIQSQIMRKLNEYNYFSSDLYPDFHDYINYQAKEFNSTKEKGTIVPDIIEKLSSVLEGALGALSSNIR